MVETLSERFPSSTLFARISPEDIVVFASESLANYLGVPKRDLVGTPLEVIRSRLGGELSETFARPLNGREANRLVADHEGRVFQIRTNSQDGVLDLLLDEVTDAQAVIGRFSSSIGTLGGELTEEEIQSLFQPERRILSLSQTRLCGYSTLAETAPPLEARFLASAFGEEAQAALLENGSSLGAISPDSVQGIHGAPRHYRDHALRAIKAVFEQFRLASAFRAYTIQSSKEMPPLAVGITTGEVLLSSLETPSGQRLAVSGSAVSLADQLSRLARPGEILISSMTLAAILAELPAGWDYVRAESENLPDLSDVKWIGDEIQPLPEGLERVVYLIGPGVSENTEMIEIYLDYVYALKAEGYQYPVPILRAVRPESAGNNISLNDDNVVASQAVQVLGKYKLQAVVGQGGMGKVWRAQDRFGNTVAVKVLSAPDVTDAQVRRFRREAEIMARLQHRNICRVFEMDEFEGIHYIVMEYIDGLTLADLLHDAMEVTTGAARVRVAADLPGLIHSIRTTRASLTPEQLQALDNAPRPTRCRILPVQQTLAIFNKVSEAVQFAHEHGVLHRDLKPGNVLIREDGEPLVADFGLAKMNSGEDSGLSMSGHVVGTLENMSPEQAESSKDVDESADVYSLGTILYQMLTGRRHFDATGNLVADAQSLRNHVPIRPRQHNPHLDSDLDIICMKALRNDPAERYRSVSALRADLEHYRKGEMISARPFTLFEVSRKLIQRNLAMSAVVFGSLLVFTGGSLLSFLQINDRRIVAEGALQTAKLRTEEAEVARQSAEASAAFARKNEEKALAALKAKDQAELAANLAKVEATKATAQSHQARQETEKERAERLSLTEKNRDLSKQLDDLAQQKTPESPSFTPASSPVEATETRSPELSSARKEEAIGHYFNAASRFSTKLPSYELSRHERSPEEVLDVLSKCFADVAQALVIDPNLPVALSLKGRMHLACREWEPALAAFHRAKANVPNYPDSIPADEPDRLIKWTEQLKRPIAGSDKLAYDEMNDSTQYDDRIVAGLVDYFRKNSPNRQSPTAPLQRPLSAQEAILTLIEENPGPPPDIQFYDNELGKPALRIHNAASLKNLSSLKKLSVTDLDLHGLGRTDWVNLFALLPERLILSSCNIPELPPYNVKGLGQLKEFGVEDSKLAHIDFLRGAVQLERLTLNHTEVKDLSPITSRRLKFLEIIGMIPNSVLSLQILPLETLIISPELAADGTRIRPLRFHRTLKYVRTPEDPESQTAFEFWKKVDAGAYSTSAAR